MLSKNTVFYFVSAGMVALKFSCFSFALELVDKTAIEQLVAQYTDSWNQHDVLAISKVYTSDADVVNKLGQKFTGILEIETQHRKTHSTFLKNAQMKATLKDLRELAPTVVLGYLDLEITNLSEPEASAYSAAIFTQIYVKKGNQWLITASSAIKKQSL